MTSKPITSQQEQIINLLYQFRYLLVKQLMKLLSHKDSRRIREWLHDLVKKKYLTQIKVYCRYLSILSFPKTKK